MKPIGSDGRPIPTPPEAHPWRDGLLSVGKYGLRTGMGFLVFGVVTALVSYQTWLAKGWTEIGLALLRAIGVCLVGGVITVAAITLIPLAFWPLTRKQYGYKLERQIDRLSQQDLDEMIESARQSMRGARDVRISRGWTDWMAWLQVRAAQRQAIARAPTSWTVRPDPGTVVVMGVMAAVFVAFGIWLGVTLASQNPEPWIFVMPLVPCGFGAYLYGEVATLRIELTSDRLTLYKFWRIVWSAPRKNAVVIEDSDVYPPVYRVFASPKEKQTGVIVAAPFRASDLETLADWFRVSE